MKRGASFFSTMVIFAICFMVLLAISGLSDTSKTLGDLKDLDLMNIFTRSFASNPLAYIAGAFIATIGVLTSNAALTAIGPFFTVIALFKDPLMSNVQLLFGVSGSPEINILLLGLQTIFLVVISIATMLFIRGTFDI